MPSSIPYSLFVYKWELKINRTRVGHLQKAKLNLTKDLVSKSLRNIGQFSNVEGIQCLRRSIEYKLKLENVVHQRQTYVFTSNCRKITSSPEEVMDELKESVKKIKLSD
ncbi:hypothetical protein ACFFRR_002155 [Megaselia abdita]